MYRTILVAVAVTLSAGLLALATTHKKAEAAYPGNSGRIAFLSGQGYPLAIHTINPDGSAPERITQYPPGLADPWSHPVWSPDGTRIAYAAVPIPGNPGNTFDIYTVSANGGTPTRVTSATRWADTKPVWSPNGKKLAFVRTRDDGGFDEFGAIYTIDASGAGTPTRLITRNTTRDGTPVWSPDGRKIAFLGVETTSSGKPSLYVVSSRGGTATRLASSRIVRDPTWSPDGDRIAYTASPDIDTQTDIRTTSITGGAPTNVTRTKTVWEIEPTWSPGGRRIAYIYDAPNNQPYTHGLRAIAATGEGLPYRIIPSADHPDLFPIEPDWGVAAPPPPS